jgi:peptidoglycan/LPS O-acetylase OafA/YrhL
MNFNLISINIGRGLAALSVFVYHYGIGQVLAKYTGLSGFIWIAVPGATYAVPLFFVISGFCIHGSEWSLLNSKATAFDLRRYAEKRFRRIYPVYVVALIFSCAVSVTYTNLPSWGDFWVHVFLLQGFSTKYFNSINVVLWTISIEVFFYVIYPMWLMLRLKIGLTRAVLAGTALSIFSCVLTAVYWYPYELPARWFFLNTWGGWLAGALLAETIISDPEVFKSWMWWAVGLAVWTLYLWNESSLVDGRLEIVIFPMRIYLSVWLVSLLVLWEKSFAGAKGVSQFFVRGLSLIGLASYSLYLFHEPATYIRFYIEGFLEYGQFKLIFDTAYFFLVLGASCLSYQLLERKFLSRPRSLVADPLLTQR